VGILSLILRSAICAAGMIMFFLTMKSLVRAAISERQSIVWIFFSAVVIAVGLFPGLTASIARVFEVDYIPSIVFMIAILLLLYGVFYCFKSIAELQRRVQELAMQVSLLNQENSMLLKEPKDREAAAEAHQIAQ
jgi:hypothetical protein